MTEWFASGISLSDLETECWTLLAQAVTNRECGWRLPVLATSSENGVQQRTLVLRGAVGNSRRLMFHTDRRSPKHAQIAADPRVSLLFYDSALKVQLSIRGTARLHRDDPMADQQWASSPPETLRGYLAPVAPGTVLSSADSNLPVDVQGRIPDRNAVECGRNQFVVIHVCALSLEWLHLSHDGNRRARFDYVGDDEPQSAWIAP